MKIKSLYISAFGGVKDLRLDLSRDFTVIFGENEQGKTTVMSFIKMMFYGSERARGDLQKSPRKKYAPWDNSQPAGSIDFIKDGKNYRLERVFGDSNSTDKITLINTDLNTRESVSADIGTRLFGLSAAAFERSIFIGQFGFPESNAAAEGEINSKLSNIALTGSEDTSFDEVYDRLMKAKLQLSSKSGRTGAYDKNQAALKALNDRLLKAEDDKQKIVIGRQKAAEIVKEIEEMQKKADGLKAKIEKEQDFKNAEKLRELLSLKAELDEVTKKLTLENGVKIDDMFLKKIDFCLSKIGGVRAKLEVKENENKVIKESLELALNPSPDITPEKAEAIENKIKALEKTQDGLQSQYDTLSAYNQKPQAKKDLALLIMSLLLLGVGGVAYMCDIYVCIALLSAGALGVAAWAFLKFSKKEKYKNLQNQLFEIKLKQNELLTVISMEKANLNAINTALHTTVQMVEKQQQNLNENLLIIDKLLKEKEEFENDLKSLLGSTFDCISDDSLEGELSRLSSLSQSQKEIKQKINYILKDVGNITYTEAAEKIEASKGFDTTVNFDEIKQQYDEIRNLISDRKTAATEILTEIKAMTRLAESPEALKTEIAELSQKTAAQKHYLDALSLALTVLSDSFSEVRRNYGSALDSKTAEIFSGITGGKYKSVNVSKSFTLSVEKADLFGSFDSAFLSSGTVDQAYLSLRLALSELMAEENGSLPVLLDDSLAQFDDRRTLAALEFLKKYSQKSQIILFTCHKAVRDDAASVGAECVVI